MNKEIVLTYCPSSIEKNRICGHTFEVMDYFLLFFEFGYPVKIFIQEHISKELVYKSWEDKYILPKNYKKYIIFSQKKIIISKDILIFTGGFHNGYLEKYKLIYKKIILMRCNPFFKYDILKLKNYIVLEDQRVYEKYGLSTNGIHYVKKINFKYFKSIKNVEQNKTLIYINSNLRKMPDNILKEKDKYLVITGDTQLDESYLKAPVFDLFEKFSTFLYTETTRKFDCSPRLIAECKFYNKEVLFNFNKEDYFKIDSGLYWRWLDIKDNFKNLYLTKNDEIIKLIKD